MPTCRNECVGKSCIQSMATQSGRNGWQSLMSDTRVPEKPSNATIGRCVAEEWRKSEPRARRGGQSSDEFSTNPMTRVAARFDDGNLNIGAAQCETERKASQAAADDLDRARTGHKRRVAIMR